METIKIFGLQRSGTNYLAYILDANFEDVKTVVNMGAWKHGHHYPNVFKEEIHIAVIVKNPYAWLRSTYEYWNKYPLIGPDVSNVSFDDYVRRVTIFEKGSGPFPYRAGNAVQYWNNMNFHWCSLQLVKKQICVVGYENLLSNFTNVITKMAGIYKVNLASSIKPKNTLLRENERPKQGDSLWRKKKYYLEQKYLKHYTPELLDFVNNELDEEMMKKFGYDFVS